MQIRLFKPKKHHFRPYVLKMLSKTPFVCVKYLFPHFHAEPGQNIRDFGQNLSMTLSASSASAANDFLEPWCCHHSSLGTLAASVATPATPHSSITPSFHSVCHWYPCTSSVFFDDFNQKVHQGRGVRRFPSSLELGGLGQPLTRGAIL